MILLFSVHSFIKLSLSVYIATNTIIPAMSNLFFFAHLSRLVVLSDSFNEAFFAIRYQEISLLQIPSQENIGSIDPLVGFDEEVKLLTDHFDKLESLLTSKPSLSQNSCFPPTGD